MTGTTQDLRQYRLERRIGSGPSLDPPTPHERDCPRCGSPLETAEDGDVAWCDCGWDSGPPEDPLYDREEDLL